MKRLIGLFALLLPATGLALGAGAGAAPDAAADVTVRLDGVTVRLRPHTTQAVTVNRTRGYHARVTFWALSGGHWERRFQAGDGRIGYGGLVPAKQRVQGSGKTPLGTHRLPWAFGTHPRAGGWEASYRRIRRGDYWVLDNASEHYNQWRSRSQGGFRWRLPASDDNASEHLRDHPQQYEYAVTTSFNRSQVRDRGGAIFLHVNGSGATAGCVSAPRWFLRRVLNRLDVARAPVIAIGR